MSAIDILDAALTTTSAAPYVVGLDLSYSATGLASWDRSARVVKAQPPKYGPLITRCNKLASDLAYFTNQWRGPLGLVDLVVIEDQVHRSPAAAQLGVLHGVVRLRLLDLGVPVLMVPPATLKKYATGKGNASKPDIRMAVFRRFGMDIADDNECDAWVLRSIGRQVLGAPLVKMPAAHVEALAKLGGAR
jgi:Holliday junction resolvasome RuvABC endonuclease subunit